MKDNRNIDFGSRSEAAAVCFFANFFCYYYYYWFKSEKEYTA